jgi:hypothetical protein
MPVMIGRRFGQAGKGGQTHLPFFRAFDSLPGGGDAGPMAIYQLTAEPTLE